jgi:hypothetical protein
MSKQDKEDKKDKDDSEIEALERCAWECACRLCHNMIDPWEYGYPLCDPCYARGCGYTR